MKAKLPFTELEKCNPCGGVGKRDVKTKYKKCPDCLGTGKGLSKWSGEELEDYRHEFTKNTLRRASHRWPWRNVSIKEARIERGVYRCAFCQKPTPNKDRKVDHKDPVVDTAAGFTGWDSYVNRLYIGTDGFQVLCSPCHATKTRGENELRKEVRQRKAAARAPKPKGPRGDR